MSAQVHFYIPKSMYGRLYIKLYYFFQRKSTLPVALWTSGTVRNLWKFLWASVFPTSLLPPVLPYLSIEEHSLQLRYKVKA